METNRLTMISAFYFVLNIFLSYGSMPTILNYGKAEYDDGILKTSYDFIIVGAGSAGSVVAGRLTEDPSVNVLLIEAGGYPPIKGEIPAQSLTFTQYDWQFKTAPQNNSCLIYPDNKCMYSRGKALGGSTAINDMIYIRGNHKDYDNWALLGNDGWSWKDVLPYFLKSEGNCDPRVANDTTYHNSKGPLTVSSAPFSTKALGLFLKSGEELGYPIRDVNAQNQSGFMPILFTMRNGARCGTYKGFLLPAFGRCNLKIITGGQVIKILLDANNNAIGVLLSHKGTEYNVTAKKEIILSAGVIGSPQILMLSGIGPSDHLNQHKIPVIVNLPGVGSNFQDHVGNGALSWSSNMFKTITNSDLKSRINWKKWLFLRSGPLTLPHQLEGVGFMSTTDVNDDWPDAEFTLSSTNNGLADQAFPSKGSFSVFPLILRTKSIGSVRLQNSNPYSSPVIDPKYLSHPDDVKLLLKATKMALQLINSTAFHKYNVTFNSKPVSNCENLVLYSDDYWICAFRYLTIAGWHGVGTCKMGTANDSMAVVDPAGLRVYKVKRLRVIDASIMPRIVSGNTNAPTIMIAEKACDAIMKQWGLKVSVPNS